MLETLTFTVLQKNQYDKCSKNQKPQHFWFFVIFYLRYAIIGYIYTWS